MALLLVELDSGVVVVTATVFVCGPGGVEAGTVKAAVTVAEPPAAIVARLQLKSPTGGAGVQEPWVGVVVARVTAVHTCSVTITVCALEGPALLTTMV